MSIYFPGNTYDTPENRSRSIGNRFFLGSRWYFYARFLAVIFKYRRYALKGTYSDQLWAKSSYEIFQAIEDCGGRFNVRGLDNLRQSTEPVVLVSNHMSTLETMIFPVLIAPIRPVTFVVKDGLIKDKIFGPIMRSRDPVVVGRENSRRDLQTVMNKGKEILSNDRSIIIFPQSTRHNRFDPEKFNSLGIKLAARAGVKAIPVAIKTDFWGNGQRMKEFGPISPEKTIHIHFGEPMTIQGNGKEEHKNIVQFIQTNLENFDNADRRQS